MIAKTAVIHPNVRFGKNCVVEDYCIIGCPFAGYTDEPTVIGDNAVIRSHTVIYAGNAIGNNFMTGHKANIRELNTIGDNVSIGTHSVIEHHVLIGTGVRVHSMVFIPEYTVLEEGCWIGPNVVVTNDPYPQSPKGRKKLKPVTVKKKAKIGANVTLIPGVTVGEGALVGAGSVVVADVDGGAIYAGYPAKFIREIHY